MSGEYSGDNESNVLFKYLSIFSILILDFYAGSSLVYNAISNFAVHIRPPWPSGLRRCFPRPVIAGSIPGEAIYFLEKFKGYA